MAELLQQDDFAPHVNKLFRFGDEHQLRLATVEAGETRNLPPDQRKPFTLVFHGPGSNVMPEGFYAAEAEGGARFDLYVIPIHTGAPASERQDYQAVFN